MPNGDIVLAFDKPNVDILGEKLILKNYLVTQNYEISKENYFCTERNNSLAAALDFKEKQLALVEGENRVLAAREQFYNDHTNTLTKAVESEKKKTNRWKAGAAAGIVLGLVGGVLIAQ